MFLDQPDLDIPGCSFFREHQEFPSVDEIQEQSRSKVGPKKHAVLFPELKLFVKFGWGVQTAEGKCLYTIRQKFGDSVPVPELYGWRTDKGVVYLFMQLVTGVTLEERWSSLVDEERVQVCQHLGNILQVVRSLEQADTHQGVGQIDGGPLRDIAFPVDVIAGPFASVKAFNDWFSMLYRRNLKDLAAFPPDPYRSSLPDDVAVKFTHGDLHPSNIMVPKSGPPNVISIVDWQQAGWLPEYWEARKATYTAKVGGEWETRFIPIFLEVWEDTWLAWDFYVSATGN